MPPHRTPSTDSPPVSIRKLNLRGEATWSYSGVVQERGQHHIRLEARFDRQTLELGYATFEPGDRFVEWFFTNRWYNIFEVHSAHDDRIRGWYCNVTKPATIEDAHGVVSAVDLALDVWIGPDGSVSVLDEDEFAALDLSESDRRAAVAAVAELQLLAAGKHPPFDGSGELAAGGDG